MTKIMPESKQEVRYQTIKPVLDKQISIKELTNICQFSERTIKYWLARYRSQGFKGLADKSTRPYNSPNKTPNWLRKRILEIKKETSLGGQKIHWLLKKEAIGLSESTVNRVLKQEGKTRRYRKKREYIYQPKAITIPGEVVELDIKFGISLGMNEWWYQYTAIDKASRWRFLKAYKARTNNTSLDFLESLIVKASYLFGIKAVKTDNDAVFTNRVTGYANLSEFTNLTTHPFDTTCQKHNIIHYLITPGKPTQNGCVERSHRSDNEYFYKYIKDPQTIEEYNYRLRLWNLWYNDLPHCALGGLSPNEYLVKKVQNVLT